MFLVRVLGGLSVTSTEGSVPTAALQRRRLSLVAILALAGDRGLSRERIQSYLWPESDSVRARHALEQLLYTTRRDLGFDAVTSSTTELRLNPAIVRADLGLFDEAIRRDQWEEAVDLYAGPVLNGQHLADSAELERWIDSERMRREQDYLRALDALANAATRHGDVADAVQWRRRQSAADSLSVPVALELMRALEAAGDGAGAIQHARLYQQLVAASLEVEPDPAVRALADAITARSAAASNDRGSGASSDPALPHPEAGEAMGQPASGRSPTQPLGRIRRQRAGVGRASAFVVGLSGLATVLVMRSQSPQPASAGAAAVPGHTVTRDAERAGANDPSRARQTVDPEARALYLRARTSWEKRTKEPLEQAVVLFRQATERDPSYAAAYAGLAQSYAMLGYFGFAAADAMFPKARAAAQRAIALDSATGEAYAALGQALAWQHSWTEAETAYKRAIELAPEDATAHQWYALLLAYLGRAREAVVHTGHASQLDPLSVQVNNMHGMMLYYAGDLDGALRQYERTVDAEPDSAWVRQNPWVMTNFSRVAAAAGRHTLAVRLATRALEVVPSHPRPAIDLAYAYVAAGQPDSARAAFARADATHPHFPVYRAILHGLLGERDEAFAWFDRVTEWPLPSLVTLNCEPRLAALRADPRFRRVRERLEMLPH
jgi:DNA-binding SARP family transcriptional activator/Flp pilus assembly protein TadD